jgi:ketosteroid isomerase-like protein
VETYVNNFADDVFWAPPNSPIAKSKLEIKDGISNSFNRVKIDLQSDIFELKSFGDHAYAIFSGKVTFYSKTESDTTILQPACIMLFKKTDDEWKISRQIYNFRNYQE